jgi:uncharacterized protein YdbL (DUF1318 family)
MKADLENFYKALIRKGNLLELEQARSQGRLLDDAQRCLGRVETDVANILRTCTEIQVAIQAHDQTPNRTELRIDVDKSNRAESFEPWRKGRYHKSHT